uniref:Uncharacterized protein n=1 Tax=Escherichia coli TaxID=562 RepID=A0A6G5ZY86_ECOLX|nr:Hypothetical protein pJIE250-3_0033 [Escherichia coli]
MLTGAFLYLPLGLCLRQIASSTRSDSINVWLFFYRNHLEG